MVAIWTAVRDSFGTVTTWVSILFILALIIGLALYVRKLWMVKEHLKQKIETMQRELESWHRDILTNLLSRRMWLEEFKRAFAVAYKWRFDQNGSQRASDAKAEQTREDPSRGLTLITVDVDHFSLVNNTFGHDIGDVVLKKLGELINLICRPGDLAGRWGGEEFVIALNTDVFGAQAFIKRLRKVLAATQFVAGAETFNITISAGIVQLVLKDSSLEQLMKRSDELLYQAKKEGRDRYCMQECDGVHTYEH